MTTPSKRTAGSAAPVRLPGLDPDKVYEVSPLDVSLDLAKQDIANGQSPLGWWKAEGVRMTGRALATTASARRHCTRRKQSFSRPCLRPSRALNSALSPLTYGKPTGLPA